MRRFFDPELESYRSQIIRMLLLTHQQLNLASEALLEHDHAKAKRVLEIEEEVDRLEVSIDAEAVRFIGLRSPIASELRLIMAGSRMSHEFERIGDEAKKIAKRAMRNPSTFPEGFRNRFSEMHRVADSMLEDLHHAINKASESLAVDVIKRDIEIDLLNKEIYPLLLDKVEQTDLVIKTGFELIACSRAIERIGDHAQNIAEILIFFITGQDIRIDD